MILLHSVKMLFDERNSLLTVVLSAVAAACRAQETGFLLFSKSKTDAKQALEGTEAKLKPLKRPI